MYTIGQMVKIGWGKNLGKIGEIIENEDCLQVTIKTAEGEVIKTVEDYLEPYRGRNL